MLQAFEEVDTPTLDRFAAMLSDFNVHVRSTLKRQSVMEVLNEERQQLLNMKKDPEVPMPYFYMQVNMMLVGFAKLWGEGRFRQIEWPDLANLLPNIARQHENPNQFISLGEELAKRYQREGTWRDLQGSGLSVPGNVFHAGERRLRIINTPYDLSAIAMNHLTREFMTVLLQRHQPTERDTYVFNGAVHDVLVIDGVDYSTSEPSDLIEIAELCGSNERHRGNWMSVLNSRQSSSVSSYLKTRPDKQ